MNLYIPNALLSAEVSVQYFGDIVWLSFAIAGSISFAEECSSRALIVAMKASSCTHLGITSKEVEEIANALDSTPVESLKHIIVCGDVDLAPLHVTGLEICNYIPDYRQER
ncbi:unnamed protein product [Somion occarium]|uniref:Uncharacterized protein n=1 Tax=Somion occarium TaxID=3059160 RepID=A0ABP1CLX2_9APHY